MYVFKPWIMQPLVFEPFLRTMVWGGDKIAPYKGISTDIPHIGENHVSARSKKPAVKITKVSYFLRYMKFVV